MEDAPIDAQPSQPAMDTDVFSMLAAQLLVDRRCDDVELIDVRGLSQVCDFVLIASGSSDRETKSVGAELASLGKGRGFPCYRSNRDGAVTWIVIDFVTVVVHLFEPSRRAYYDLENMWSDAPRIPVPERSSGSEEAAG